MAKSTLGFKKTDLKSCWAKNNSARNLPGEKWKAVPGLEDTHEVSNYGRFRCLDKMIYPENGKKPYFRKGHIMSPHIAKSPNYFTKDFTCHVNIAIERKKEVTSFSIRRLVYHCFVEPIELHGGPSPQYLIIPKDGNGLNTYYKNLKKVSKSENEVMIYKKDRIPNTFKSLSPKKRSEMAKKGAFKKMKSITQYNKNGERIACYPSISDASLQTGIQLNTISNAAHGRILTAGGFVWRLGKGRKKMDFKTMLTKRYDVYLSKVSQPITQYNLQGKKVAVFNSIREACRKTGYNKSTISACLNKRLNSAYGFVWKKGIGPKKINVPFESRNVSIIQYSTKGKMIAAFPSMLAAAKKTNIPYHQIRKAIADKDLLTGYGWKINRPV